MVNGIIGRKVGMTQVFDEDGTVHPATVIKAGPCVVVQAKTIQTDGYESVQLAFVEETPAKVRKPMAGHYKKASVPPTRVRREVKLAAGSEPLKTGDSVLVSIFANGERVDVIGVGRGKLQVVLGGRVEPWTPRLLSGSIEESFTTITLGVGYRL